MAINKKWNKRIDITLPKTQYEWIEKQAKKLEVSKSKFISWILARRIKAIAENLAIYGEQDHNFRTTMIENDIAYTEEVTDEEIDKLIAQINSHKKQRN